MSEELHLRPVHADDLGVVLPMNNAAVPAVSRIGMADLEVFAVEARWFTVAEHEGTIAGFLIGLHGPGLGYDSLNYRAFCERFPEGFLYVDRIVVDPGRRSAGIGAALYRAFVEHGRSAGADVLTAEVNVRPRNEGSLRFHRRFGFRPVGEQDTDGGTKRVQLLTYDLNETTPPLDAHRITDLTAAADPDLAQRLEFVFDLDRLKTVQRRSLLVDGSRFENTAEHSWHVAMIARALAPLADETIDVERVVQILLVHDIVEADAGDTYIYDAEAAKQKEALETAAAERIFGLLPGDEGRELHELWLEYERRDTPDGRFAYACDRLQPFLLNAATGGRSWEAHGVHVDQVREIMAPVGEVAPRLGQLVDRIIDEAVAGGHLAVGAR